MERSQRAIVHGVSKLEAFFLNLGKSNCKISVKHSISISIFLIPLQSRVEMVNGVLMIHNVNQSDAECISVSLKNNMEPFMQVLVEDFRYAVSN